MVKPAVVQQGSSNTATYLSLNPSGASIAQNVCESFVQLQDVSWVEMQRLATAYCDEQFEPRNAYESTKLAAEQILAAEFGDRLNTAVIRCSLIVGAREDGWIARFNGLYRR